MAIREILRLGHPKLYEVSTVVQEDELSDLAAVIEDLRDTLIDFREKHGMGRAIAAPQIGVMKRLIYIQIDEPMVIYNPVLFQKSKQMMTLWDDCMSFPDLLVKVRRHRSCKMTYRDDHWNKKSIELEGALSELIQHENDHLYGILAVSRAVDEKSFCLRSEFKKHYSGGLAEG
ncbi:MAG: peptide deformylase [Balneolaceae bacterium]|nr:peptide deformylase [Balneolaceae bacterium]